MNPRSFACSGQEQSLAAVGEDIFSVQATERSTKTPAEASDPKSPENKTVENEITSQIHHCCHRLSGEGLQGRPPPPVCANGVPPLGLRVRVCLRVPRFLYFLS